MPDNKTFAPTPPELLLDLIAFNTTNPPGNEGPCIAYIDRLLKQAGLTTTLLAKDPQRPNLIARLKGRGAVPPLLLYGHVDVVSTQNQKWLYDPFQGTVARDFIWGRGALDMKGGLSMMISAFTRAARQGLDLPGDVILCLVCDEEERGEYGARFLVENHAQYFQDVRYALGEFGGFTLYLAGKKFYPIEVAQKQKCGIRAIIKGPAGHGAMVMRNGVMAKLGRMLDKLDKNQLPIHITQPVQLMFEAMIPHLPFPNNLILKKILDPRWTRFVLNRLGDKGKAFVPMFENTVNATIVRGGDKINVIPGQIEVDMDARLLPGYKPADLIEELHTLIGDDIELQELFFDPGAEAPDMGLFSTLAAILEEADPEGIPIPLFLTASTDAKFFSRLGIQTYGFIPMQLPPDLNFSQSIHAADERIPIDSLYFGTDCLCKALQRFHA